MSFILDALKKSEHERQRHRGPSLVDVPARRMASERPWWVFALAALLILNLIVFVVVLLRKDQPQATAPAVQSAPLAAEATPAPTAAPARSAPVEPQRTHTDPTVRSLAEEAGVLANEEELTATEPNLADAAQVPARAPIVSPIAGPSSTPVRSAPAPSGATSRPEETLPTINDITASGRAQFPPLHLDIHVYATNTADRFVFINMKKYREGDGTAEGMHVEQIRRDGVVLNHQGTRFVLPRQ